MKKLRGGYTAPIQYGKPRSDMFELLHDDIVISILCKLSSTASSPSDFIAVLHTCKRLNKLGFHPLVLSKTCSKALAVRAKNWCEEAHRFLKLCVNAGNTEAYYTLGMISLPHVDALRELGHCFQDGYGVRKNIAEGRRLLVQANERELASVLQYEFNQMHPVNRFMVEWFGLREDGLSGQGLRMCSYKACGRPETRRNEFRRCSGCGKVNYCSRGCQAHDWRVHHREECAPMEMWMGHTIDDVEDDDNVNGYDGVMNDRTVEIVEGEVGGI
ncbi:hypothetical protein L1987_66856 [Smallanthus sonchifolius]|uniref:Uncharacterized protein n=1 Tax=Smallanthus sonchifolius TaxID=185202 RepID=A0ACB9BYN9_9ASTR|nr:hypothetical protein L1987_66856 [Smallanthus sonchifolius]